MIFKGTPDFKMGLMLDNNNKLNLRAKIESVFDICRTYSNSVVFNSKTKILRCLVCKDVFTKESSRQIYCGKIECEAEQKRINKRNFDNRKKSLMK